jgi:hypothetical protein
MSWIFEVLQISAGLCAIPIYSYLTNPRSSFEPDVEEGAMGALIFFTLAMALDFLGSLPGLGIGTKSIFGQDILEPLSHLAIVGALVVGLWSAKQISTGAVRVMVVLGLIGFGCSTFVADDVVIGQFANGLMPLYSWMVTAICVVMVVRLAAPKPKDQFNAYLFFGILVLIAAAAQHELIAQWASGNAHYPILK